MFHIPRRFNVGGFFFISKINLEVVLNLFYLCDITIKKHTIMKKYIVHTASDWSFAVAASNYREAIATGRRICRHSGEKFTRVRMVK